MTKDELLFDPHDVLGPQNVLDEDVRLKNLNQMGYFADTLLGLTEMIKQRKVHKLIEIDTSGDWSHMYHNDSAGNDLRTNLFLPLTKVKLHLDPQRRPCRSVVDFARAAHIVNIWDSFVYRDKVVPKRLLHSVLVRFEEQGGQVIRWNIGGTAFDPKVLFDCYEVKDPETGNWHPFGVIMSPEEIAAGAEEKPVLDAPAEEDEENKEDKED